MRIVWGPYLQNVNRRAITLMWVTDGPGNSIVEFDPAAEIGWSAYAGRPKPAYSQHVKIDRADTVHAVRLEGLRQEWEYFYRVASEGKDGSRDVSEGASFRTAVRDESPFCFVSYGDNHRVHEAHRRNAELARSCRPTLCVGTGDTAQDSIACFEEGFFGPAGELLKYTPWFATMGNHDSVNEGFFRYFSYPEPRYWYSFNYGCAHFVMLNSNMDYRPGSEQWHWAEWDLARFHRARWKFVFFHHPPYCSSNCEIAATRVLCPLFEKHAVDVVFNAHATRYERFHPLTGGRYDPARGIVYYVSGGGGYDMSMDCSLAWDHVHPYSAFQKSANHFLLTHVARDEIRTRAIDTDDRQFDDFTLRKAPAEVAPLPEAGEQREYPRPVRPGAVVAGLEEGPVRWVLPAGQFTPDAEVTRASDYSIRFSHDGTSPVLPAVRRIVVDDHKAMFVAGNKAVEVSVWVKTELVSGGVTVSVATNGDMGFLDRTGSEPICGTRDWTNVSIVTPRLFEYVYWIRLVLSAQPGSAGRAWFDDVSVRLLE